MRSARPRQFLLSEPCQSIATHNARSVVIDAKVDGAGHRNINRQSRYFRLVKHIGEDRSNSMMELILDYEINPLRYQPRRIFHSLLRAVTVIT